MLHFVAMRWRPRRTSAKVAPFITSLYLCHYHSAAMNTPYSTGTPSNGTRSPEASAPTPGPVPLHDDADHRTRWRKAFYRHLLVYVLVNAGLWLLAWHQGRTQSVYPALGWGIGLAFHAARAFLWSPSRSHQASSKTGPQA